MKCIVLRGGDAGRQFGGGFFEAGEFFPRLARPCGIALVVRRGLGGLAFFRRHRVPQHLHLRGGGCGRADGDHGRCCDDPDARGHSHGRSVGISRNPIKREESAAGRGKKRPRRQDRAGGEGGNRIFPGFPRGLIWRNRPRVPASARFRGTAAAAGVPGVSHHWCSSRTRQDRQKRRRRRRRRCGSLDSLGFGRNGNGNMHGSPQADCHGHHLLGAT